MAESDAFPDEAAFLKGAGETAALIAAHDWAATPLGPIRDWPQSLRTAAAIMLRSPLPMTLLWGTDGVVMFNDAYVKANRAYELPRLGSKARESWPELSAFLNQVLSLVLGGDSLEYRDLELRRVGPSAKEKVWYDLNYSPVPDNSGRPAGVLCIAVETTERVLAERKSATLAERQRRRLEEAPGFVAVLGGPSHVFEFVNAAHKRVFGDRDALGRPFAEVFPDLIEQGHPEILDKVYGTGQRQFGRARPVYLQPTPDAPREELFLDFVLEPVTGEGGQVTGVFMEGFDVTEQVRAQTAVSDSERRLSAAIAIAQLGAFEWDLESHAATLDARAREIFGFAPDESVLVEDVLARIDPQDAPRLRRRGLGEAPSRREHEYGIHLPDGTRRAVVSLSDVVAGPDGRPTRVIGVFDDVTEQRRFEKRQRLLINELNHRVKNTLATVQSIAAQTLRSAPDVTNARDAFEARLVALAAAHDLLTAQSWNGARLSDVVASAMAPFETVARPQISRSGPPVWLSAPRALALSLALHELATNAVKYGSLSRPEGRVSIRWNITPSDELTLSWVEKNGPPVAKPTRNGFGSRLLQRSLPHELRGQVSFEFDPAGVRFHIRCPLEDAVPSAEPQIAEI